MTTTESPVRSKLVPRAALLAVACALLAPAPASGQREKLSSFLKGAVTFTLPEGWPVYMSMDTDTQGAAELRGFYPEPPEGKLRAQAFMTASFEHEYGTLKERIEAYERSHPDLKRHRAGDVVLSSTYDDVNWRTTAGKTVDSGKTYLTLGRSGLVNHKWVGLSVSFPLDGVSPEVLKRVVADFNAVCESLKIEGQNKFESKLDADKILERLGADEENDDSEDRNNRGQRPLPDAGVEGR
ncbi:MAG TPA: hypothetical protein VM936_06505 [Pyrinomonadaceae bacterium]|nr:hypothetical protein [Pyrinomonadaceae bacterium]